MEKPTPDDVGKARRQFENQLRVDCSRLLKMGVDPEDIYQALLATSEFWFGELQDINIKK